MTRLAFLFSILLCISTQLFAQNIAEMRGIFYEAVKNPSAAENYKSVPPELKSSQPLIIAYFGGLKTMMANTVSNPYKKLKFFNEGKDLIEKAVNENKTDWEIRFVRFMIQCKIPSFLLYNNINEDKKIILEELSKKDKHDNYVKKVAVRFLVDSGKLNNNEIDRLNN